MYPLVQGAGRGNLDRIYFFERAVFGVFVILYFETIAFTVNTPFLLVLSPYEAVKIF